MIIGIEGVCSSGKTTLTKRLIQDLNIGSVSEVTAIIPETLEFPLSADHAENNERLILDVECIRIKIAKEMIKGIPKKIMILDRSVLSTIVISLANDKINNWNSAKYLIGNCANISKTSQILPDLIVHLDTEEANRTARNSTRSNKLNKCWTNSRFNELQNKYYNAIYDCMEKEDICNVIRLDANMTEDKIFNVLNTKLEQGIKKAKKNTAEKLFMRIKENALEH